MEAKNALNMEQYQVLSECLVMAEAMARRFSKNEAMTSPKPGYEKAWEEEKRKADILRGMIKEVRYGAEASH